MDKRQSISARPVSLHRFASDVLADQVRIWSFPKLLLQGKHWQPTLLFITGTCLFFAIDPFDPHYFRHAQQFHEFNLIVSGHNATVAMWAVMMIALVAGLLRSDHYLTQTFLYAAQAVIDSEILTQIFKGIDRRVRPQDIHGYAHFGVSWFRDAGSWYAGPGSFPSGHMIAAISIATVFAIRYRHHRWAPWTAYGAAGTIGFSRVTLLSHFPSDVFAATVLGYVIVRYVVLNEPKPLALADAPLVAAAEHATAVAAIPVREPVASLPYRQPEAGD